MRVIYTCITGGYDAPLPQPRFPDTRYICFTDRTHLRARGWDMRPPVPDCPADRPDLVNRYHKMMPHRLPFDGATETLYIDGNIQLVADPAPVFDRLRDADLSIAAFRHPRRDTIDAELAACLDKAKLTAQEHSIAVAMVAGFHAQGFVPPATLTVNSLLFRRSDPRLDAAMMTWWDIVSQTCKRDQISLGYALWTQGLGLLHADDVTSKKALFRRVRHRESLADRLRRKLGLRQPR